MSLDCFFAHEHLFNILRRHVISRCGDQVGLRIWQAGCRKGHLAYSLAVTLCEALHKSVFRRTVILASEAGKARWMVRTASRGMYPQTELGRVPSGLLEKYFQPVITPGYLRLVELIRGRVVFLDDDSPAARSWRTHLDMVLWRNTLGQEVIGEDLPVMEAIVRALKPGGFLVTTRPLLWEPLPGDWQEIWPGQVFQKLIPGDRHIQAEVSGTLEHSESSGPPKPSESANPSEVIPSTEVELITHLDK